jgi:hypothetical protein
MSPGITLELHWWRRPGLPAQRELFFYGICLGFVTLSICRVCVIESYAKLRDAAAQALAELERKEGH